jgi:A-factor type gamma-butyrolactone 1'-reductase (1S-forming)
VNTSSVGGLVGNFGLAPYIASKHGVIGLTKAAAFEYGKQNLRINAIAPGSTATEMFLGALEHTPRDRRQVQHRQPDGAPRPPRRDRRG